MWTNSSGQASKQFTSLRWKTKIRKSICIILPTELLIKSIADTDDHENEHLPYHSTARVMKNFIDGKYAGARIVEVDVEDDKNDWDFGFTEVDIIHSTVANRNVSKEVLFDKGREWYSTSWEIRQKRTAHSSEQYSQEPSMQDIRLDEAEYIEMQAEDIYYRIELRRG